ncbi:MAG: hypothetical protein GEU28_07785 [Dehalococcoidia bacterium]|nr:hypothetical protein [Dehalococcoidia bacterium]
MTEPKVEVEGPILLNRAVATISPERIEIRPDKVLVVGPLLGVLFGLACALGIWFGRNDAPTWLLVLLLLGALFALPFAGMSLVYTIVGANIVIDRAKKSIVFQQGVLGLGVGTREVVPFWKMSELRLDDLAEGGRGPTEEFAQWQITLLKDSGRVLQIASLTYPRDQEEIALSQMRRLAHAIADLAGGTPVAEPPPEATEPPRAPAAKRRRRRR